MLIPIFLAAVLAGPPGARDVDELPLVASRPAVPTPHPLTVDAGLELNRLLRLARTRDCDQAAIVAGIVAQGNAAAQPGFVALEEGALPGFDDVEAQRVSEFQEGLVLQALERLDRGAVWGAIEYALVVPKGAEPTLATRRAAVLVGGACALPEDLRRIARLAHTAAEPAVDARLEAAFRASVTRILARRPDGHAYVAGTWREFGAGLVPALVQGAGAAGDPRAIRLLAETLEVGGNLEPVTLAELCRQRAPAGIPEELLETLREMLRDVDEPIRCQSAATALGFLGDFGSVEALVELLDSPRAGLRTTVHRALCNLSGLRLPLQASAWNAWRVREGEWYAARHAELAVQIESGTESAARQALVEISLRHWERHELAEIVAAGLEREEPVLQSLACSVLAELGSPRALPALLEAAKSDDVEFAADARRACERIAAQ